MDARILLRLSAWARGARRLLPGVLVLLPACKDFGSEQASRPLPPPEPPPASGAPRAREDAPSAPRKRTPSDDVDIRSKRSAGESQSAREPGVNQASSDAEPAAAGTEAAPATSSLTLPGPSVACLASCQTAMQSCLAAPVDAGVPGFGNLELCKQAFEACRSACNKQ